MRACFSQFCSYVRVFLCHCDFVDYGIGALYNFGDVRAGLMMIRDKCVSYDPGEL